MLLKSKNTFLLKYGTLTVHFNRDTKVFLKWKYFRTDFGTRMYLLQVDRVDCEECFCLVRSVYVINFVLIGHFLIFTHPYWLGSNCGLSRFPGNLHSSFTKKARMYCHYALFLVADDVHIKVLFITTSYFQEMYVSSQLLPLCV